MGDNNFLQWRIDYSVGVQEIDDQHKEIMLLINMLLEICRGDDNAGRYEPFNALIPVIREYFQRHFETEEQRMRETHYPKYEEHKKRHDKLIDDAKKLIKKIQNEKQKMNLINTVVFFREWFVEHIYGLDKQMGEYLIEIYRHTSP